ncbi:MAG TPA: hypothetical protein VJX23_14310 [Candidatus Binataceae bacterium]|nr:hypothetical protein [Candidatus Binataceae bacterium]
MTIDEQVLSFIHRPDPGLFDSIAIDVFGEQFVSVPAYRNYCERMGIGPADVTSPDRIPMVSTLAFKYADLNPPDAATRAGALSFLTSGTTIGSGRRGRHVVARPEIYRASAIAHLRAMMFPAGARTRMLAMHPTAERMPESSLSTMISWCIEEFGNGPALCVADRAGVDSAAAIEFLSRCDRDGAPVCVLGTSAAFAALFDRLSARRIKMRLAAGSRMMDTGGAKGQALPLAPNEIIELAEDRLGLRPSHVINEYGMTELCSQLYDATALNSGLAVPAGDRIKIAPPWMRPAAIDPVTLRRVPDGTPGLLGFIDLANVSSVSAIVTEDLGIVRGREVRVLGRAIAGGTRGCALSIAEFEAAARQATAS